MDSEGQGWNRRLGAMRCGQSNLNEREGTQRRHRADSSSLDGAGLGSLGFLVRD